MDIQSSLHCWAQSRGTNPGPLWSLPGGSHLTHHALQDSRHAVFTILLGIAQRGWPQPTGLTTTARWSILNSLCPAGQWVYCLHCTIGHSPDFGPLGLQLLPGNAYLACCIPLGPVYAVFQKGLCCWPLLLSYNQQPAAGLKRNIFSDWCMTNVHGVTDLYCSDTC